MRNPGSRARRRRGRTSGPAIAWLGLLTVLTAGLYASFFLFLDPLFDLFTSGTMVGAVAVVATAMVFSLIHGSFAGLRASEKGD
jgi:hypothetical protein